MAKRIMRLRDAKMRDIINKHIGMVEAFDDDASGKSHINLFFYFYPQVEGIDYQKYNATDVCNDDIDITSSGNINFNAYMRDDLETNFSGGKSFIIFRMMLGNFMVAIENESVKYFKGCTEISKQDYIRLMYSYISEHFEFAAEERAKRISYTKNKKEFVKTDGGLKKALDNKNIIPRNDVRGACALIALATATGIEISKWYDTLTAMKFKDGYKKDACEGNYTRHLDKVLKEFGWVRKFGDRRAVQYSDLPKEGAVIVFVKRHFCVVKDNKVMDSWDSRKRRVLSYWVKEAA